MASEYVSFMLVFGLGISMVVGITITMQSLTQSVSETSADVALEKVIEKIKGSLIDGVNNERQWNGISSFEYNLDISRLLVNRYSYEISVILIDNSYYLIGKSVDTTTTNITKTSPLIFTVNDMTISGTISSSSSNPYILFEKNTKGIVVTLGNR